MNFEQIKGIVERIVTLLVGLAVGSGYIPPHLGPEIIVLLVMVASVGWGWYTNRPAALVQAVETIPAVDKVKMLPTPEGFAINAVTGSKVSVA